MIGFPFHRLDRLDRFDGFGIDCLDGLNGFGKFYFLLLHVLLVRGYQCHFVGFHPSNSCVQFHQLTFLQTDQTFKMTHVLCCFRVLLELFQCSFKIRGQFFIDLFFIGQLCSQRIYVLLRCAKLVLLLIVLLLCCI